MNVWKYIHAPEWDKCDGGLALLAEEWLPFKLSRLDTVLLRCTVVIFLVP